MAVSFFSSFIAALLAFNFHLPTNKQVVFKDQTELKSLSKTETLLRLNKICQGVMSEVLGDELGDLNFLIEPMLEHLKNEKDTNLGKDFLGKYSMEEILTSFNLLCPQNFDPNSPKLAEISIDEGVDYFYHLLRNLPHSKQLKNLDLSQSTPMLDKSGDLVSYISFSTNKHRLIARPGEISEEIKLAFITAEDKDFYNNTGISLNGIFNAFVNSSSGDQLYGGSTITQQLIKNTLLNYDRSIERKINEVLLAYSITNRYSKKRIIEYYLNYIYFGRGAYGIKAAAKAYLGKSLNQLNVNDVAFLASLPKNPVGYDPAKNYDVVFKRKNKIIKAMVENGILIERAWDAYKNMPIKYIDQKSSRTENSSSYYADAVKSEIGDILTEERNSRSNIEVFTSINSDLQNSLSKAVLNGVVDYEKYRERVYEKVNSKTFRLNNISGLIAKVQEKEDAKLEASKQAEQAASSSEEIEDLFDDSFDEAFDETFGGDPDGESDDSLYDEEESMEENKKEEVAVLPSWQIALRKKVNPVADTGWQLAVYLGNKEFGLKNGERVKASKERRGFNKVSSFKYGDLVLVERKRNNKKTDYFLRMLPEVQAAGVIMNVETGAILAATGGVSYNQSQFNRFISAKRQPGSVMKPFTYLLALDKGYQPNFMIQDANHIFAPIARGGQSWRPRGIGRPTNEWFSLRYGLEKSNNRMTAHLLDVLGDSPLDSLNLIRDTSRDFGLYEEPNSDSLSFILGAQEAKIVNIARAYSSIANGGRKVNPHMVTKVYKNGDQVYRNGPKNLGYVNVDSTSLFQLRQMLHGVTSHGTAKVLKDHSSYMAGKTGTSDNNQDAWFAGITPQIAIVVWVGYDNPDRKSKRYLKATGGGVAAPIVKYVLESEEYKNFENPQVRFPAPQENLLRAHFNHKEGYISTESDPDAVFEYFRPGTPWYDNYREFQFQNMGYANYDLKSSYSRKDQEGIDEFYARYGSYEARYKLAKRRAKQNQKEQEIASVELEQPESITEGQISRSAIKNFNRNNILVIGSPEYMLYVKYLDQGGNPDDFTSYLEEQYQSQQSSFRQNSSRPSSQNVNNSSAPNSNRSSSDNIKLNKKKASPTIIFKSNKRLKTVEEKFDLDDIF